MSFRHALAIGALALILIPTIDLAQAPATRPTTAPTTAAASTKTYAVAGHGDLKLTIPAGWTESEDPVQPGMPRTVRFTDADNKFEALISVLPPPKGLVDFNSPQKLRTIAHAQVKQMLTTSKETSVALEDLKGASANGFVYTLTDKAPAPGSYEYMTGGVVGVGDLILSTTMLMHEKNPPQRAIALQMLAAASQVSAVSPSTQHAANARLAVSLPDRKWQIALDHPGLNVLEDEMSPDKHARHLSAIDSTNGVNVSIFLEPAVTIGDAKTTRQFYFDRLKRSPLMIREDKFSEAGDIARVDYLLPDINQRHVNLYIAKEGVWVDVHISVEDVKNERQGLIDQIAKSVKLEAKEPARSPTTQNSRR
ncbi:MAG: hypothetical protein H7Z14_03910 [Anaerolineae bacterium]|nr:hypothetical protein [Phycisphaerae bacterium]